MKNGALNILIIPGSLRGDSSTAIIINHIKEQLSTNVSIDHYLEMALIPAFDDRLEVPDTVLALKARIKKADGLLFVTPEYAFGVPGALKNLLDWTVSTGDLYDKPTAVITAATNGTYAHESLLLTLKALTAKIDDDCKLLIRFVRSKIDKEGHIADIQTGAAIGRLVEKFCLAAAGSGGKI